MIFYLMDGFINAIYAVLCINTEYKSTLGVINNGVNWHRRVVA